MLEIMTVLGSSNTEPPVVTIDVNNTSLQPSDLVEFTINYDNIPAGMTLYWTLGGDFTADLIEGGIPQGEFIAVDGPGTHSVQVQTLLHETLDATRLMSLQVRSLSHAGNIMGESASVEFIYSPHPIGQTQWITPGTYSWVVPADVMFISGVAVGGGMGSAGTLQGDGGDGGALRWRNRIPVTPGETLTIKVGAGGLSSNDFTQRLGGVSGIYRGTTLLCVAAGGGHPVTESTEMTIVWVPPRTDSYGNYYPGYWKLPDSGDEIGGGEGGRGGAGGVDVGPGGGGGAGGYMGNGGDGTNQTPYNYTTGSYPNRVSHSGGYPGERNSGAAGGGAYYYVADNDTHHATPGGGVGLLGRGTTGLEGVYNDPNIGGRGGSGGTDATWTDVGIYGGGGRGQSSITSFFPGAVDGGAGAVRVIWGTGRTFPNTKTGNL